MAKASSKRSAQRASLAQLLRRIGRAWPALVVSTLLTAATVVLQLYVPILFGDAIDQIAGAGKVHFARLARYLQEISLLVALSAVSNWISNRINNRITYRTVQSLRDESIRHLQKLPLSYLDGHTVGDLVSRITADIDVISDGLLLGFTQLLTGVLTIAVTLVFMFSKNLSVSLLVVVLTPLSFLVARFISSRSFRLFQQQSVLRGKQTALVDEMIGGQKLVQAFDYTETASRRFAAINEDLMQCSQQAVFYSSLTNPSTRFVNSLIYAGVALLGIFLIPGGSLTVGGLTILLAYANQYMKPFNDISAVVTEFQNALACADRIFSLLAEPAEPEDAPSAAIAAPESVRGAVTLEQLQFSYDEARPLITDLDLTVQPGQRVAIVGPTGCGKTTLINLLMRFYEPDGGRITVDGTPVTAMPRAALRRSFGMVLQDTWIKGGTVRENIAFGRPDAPEDAIIQAAKAAHCWGFIQQLPQGLDTVLTGDAISQGQRQLLCIARVMLCLPPMLILDEATSSIDTRTEMQIQQAIETLMQGRTSFVVAHRLSTIQDADIILVMRDGKIVEQGIHAALLARGGFYATLYYSQFKQA